MATLVERLRGVDEDGEFGRLAHEAANTIEDLSAQATTERAFTIAANNGVLKMDARIAALEAIVEAAQRYRDAEKCVRSAVTTRTVNVSGLAEAEAVLDQGLLAYRAQFPIPANAQAAPQSVEEK